MPGHHAGTMLIKKEAFYVSVSSGRNYKSANLFDWYARAIELNLNSIMLPDVLVKRRIHKTNLGISRRDQRSGYVHALKAALDRRRV